jgi:hypothetical protein
MNKLDFQAEVKEVNAKKTASLDVTYKVVLLTSDPNVLALGAIDGDLMVKVSVEVSDASA